MAGSTVLLVGVGFKPGSADITRTPAVDLTRRLREQGASVEYIDSQVPSFSVDEQELRRVSADSLASGKFSAAIILLGDSSLSVQSLLGTARMVLDAGGSRRGESIVGNRTTRVKSAARVTEGNMDVSAQVDTVPMERHVAEHQGYRPDPVQTAHGQVAVLVRTRFR